MKWSHTFTFFLLTLVVLTFVVFILVCIMAYMFREGSLYITKTCLCNVYPLEPHFYIAKMGYAGVYLFFLFFALKHR